MLNKVEICGVNTARLPVLSAEQTTRLFEAMHNGDRDAREQLISGNLRLVLSVIQRFNNRGENADDLFQVGCIGLIKAIDNFDLNQGVRLSTYAVPMIIGEVRRHLRDYNTVRVSRSLRDTAYRALQVRELLTLRLERDPRMDEIARELELPEEDVVLALEAISDPVSLFDPVYSEGSGDQLCVMDQISDHEQSENNWMQSINIREGITRLGEREKKILKLRFFVGKTQMEVAEEIGISQAQVSRLEKGALAQLRKFI